MRRRFMTCRPQGMRPLLFDVVIGVALAAAILLVVAWSHANWPVLSTVLAALIVF